MGFLAPSVIYLAGCVLLILQFFCAATNCPPPDFPERGYYEIQKAEYEAGMEINYFCNGWPMYYKNTAWVPTKKVVTCQSSGNWSEPTPFCDISTKLKSLIPSFEADSRELIVIDGHLHTCIGPQKNRKEILRFSLDGELVPYAVLICFTEGRGMFNIRLSPTWSFTYDTDIAKNKCAFITTEKYQSKTASISVEISSKKNSSISLCEVTVFAKDDKWCEEPPENSVPNGQLEVSHSKAVLHCKKGFKEKDGREEYATCENNTWSYLNLECVEHKPNKEHWKSACPPPDFPETGNYEPKKAEYDVGMEINYTCLGKFSMFVDNAAFGQPKTVTCQSSGKWSDVTPLCDTLAKLKLKNLTTSINPDVKDSTLIDGNINSCFPIPNGTFKFLHFSLERKLIVYSTLICFRPGRGTIKVNITETLHDTYDIDQGFKNVGCVFSSFMKNEKKTDHVTVQVLPDMASSTLLCEILVYAKKYKWCDEPPENSIPNGQLEVSRRSAVLHCNEGFKEKDDKEVYATCKNNTWSYMNLQCVEEKPQKDHRILELEEKPRENKFLSTSVKTATEQVCRNQGTLCN
ncbi:unnamed protein product [Larinioides sclopetarius]|uniref:Sushi domain-containing protein n=1 Tax=Larinioides sclopetarius TaxID=280406 RepID=A0AAV2ARE4_9ARAC